MNEEVRKIINSVLSGEDCSRSPIIIKTESLFLELQKEITELMLNRLLVEDGFEQMDHGELLKKAQRWSYIRMRYVFPIYNKCILCEFRSKILAEYAIESTYIFQAKLKNAQTNQDKEELHCDFVMGANITLSAEVESILYIESMLKLDKLNIINNIPLIRNITHYKKECELKMQSNADTLVVKKSNIDLNLFSSKRAASEFVDIERRLFNDNYLDSDGKWIKKREKQQPQILLYQLWRNGYFSCNYLPKATANGKEVDRFTNRFRALFHITERWGWTNTEFEQHLRPCNFLACKNKENPFEDYDIKPM